MNYFIQTQPSPTEGPHAQEVLHDDFFAACEANPWAMIEPSEEGDALYLRLDLEQVDG